MNSHADDGNLAVLDLAPRNTTVADRGIDQSDMVKRNATALGKSPYIRCNMYPPDANISNRQETGGHPLS